MPVITPSAPSPSASQLASNPSSTNDSWSSSSATRSRTGSFPCSSALARWRSGPPASARSAAARSRSLGSEASLKPTPRGASRPARRSARGCRAAGRALPARARGLQQPAEIDPGRDPHLLEHRDEILGGDVAGRARRAPGSRRARRSSTRTTRPRLSAASTFASPCPRVLWKCAVSSTPGSARARAARRTRGPAAGWPSRSCRRSRPPARAGRGQLDARSRALVRRGTRPSYGQPNEVEITPSHRRPSARARCEHATQSAQRVGDRPPDVLGVVGLGGGQEAVDLVEARAVGERADRDRARSGSGRSPRRCRADRPPRAPRPPSASCGITSARTKLVTSRRRSPVAPSSSISATLVAVGTSPAHSESRPAGRPRGSAHSPAVRSCPTYRSVEGRAAARRSRTGSHGHEAW